MSTDQSRRHHHAHRPRSRPDRAGERIGTDSRGLRPWPFPAASSWDRWAEVFEAAGYAVLTPGWPDDPDTLEEAQAHPEAFASKSVRQVADHFATIAGAMSAKPVIIGHSFGGLLAQILAGRGLAAVTVAKTRRRSVASCRSRSRPCGWQDRRSATRPTATARCR